MSLRDELTCRLCGSIELTQVYEGPIRAGKPGTQTERDYTIYRCGGCDVAFPDPSPEVEYTSQEYRAAYNDSADVESYLASHDHLHVKHLEYLQALQLRGKTIADVGCGGGSFLDLVKGLAGRTIAVEPYVGYHASLRQRGHDCFGSTGDLLAAEGEGSADVVVSFHVIEHVTDPVTYLREMLQVLRPGGSLLLATPNHDDFLMNHGPAEYKGFFYRTAHLWCFSRRSLRYLAERLTFQVDRDFLVQRYDLSNAMQWMRDGSPAGNGGMPFFTDSINSAWRELLETSGYGDSLYGLWRRPAADGLEGTTRAA